ncbi:DUF2231 domain-containing protein [Nonomuraea endophytica]|uniref:Putative membrane protein n=1 Tax=Nonomuraea endophytica TaxID=714136 RepID=A0A7W8A192_9ACTN|nr:DUF2231 domain-containing protein [Nonomuraea endophytica]MBB5077701.1 putative membrane protein [Nonomuraea endophytica]
MFNEILGLPAHPLIIHFAVVLTPLLVAVSVVYAAVSRWRPQLAWAVVALSVLAPVAVFAARQSGMALKEARFATADGDLGQRIATHESFATPLLLSTLALGALSLLLVFAARNKTVGLVLSVLTVVAALVAAYYVFRAGDSGARAVWTL